MKNIILTLVIGSFMLVSPEATAQESTNDSFTIQVDGLGCPFCAYGLEKKFKEFKGIKDVKIEIETGVFSFSYPAEKKLSMEAVEKQVVKAGYTPITAKIVRADGTVENSKTAEITKIAEDDEKKVSFSVNGTCGMCKARIEKTAKDISGVASAEWDQKSNVLSVTFNKNTTSQKQIEEAIAKVGHDTENYKTDAKTYKNLPGCCHYERKE